MDPAPIPLRVAGPLLEPEGPNAVSRFASSPRLRSIGWRDRAWKAAGPRGFRNLPSP